MFSRKTGSRNPLFLIVTMMALCMIMLAAPAEAYAASKIPMNRCSFSWVHNNFGIYSGSSWKHNSQVPSLLIKYNGRELKKGTDYTCKISPKNKQWTAGAKQVIITGKGNYTGSLIKSYTILPYGIQNKNVSCASKKSGIGPFKKTSVSLSFYNKSTTSKENLKKGRDYNVSVSETKNRLGVVTKSKVTFYGIGNFTGKRSCSFNGKVTVG